MEEMDPLDAVLEDMFEEDTLETLSSPPPPLPLPVILGDIGPRANEFVPAGTPHHGNGHDLTMNCIYFTDYKIESSFIFPSAVQFRPSYELNSKKTGQNVIRCFVS